MQNQKDLHSLETKEDCQKRLSELEALATQGNSSAQLELGFIYLAGEGVEQNYEKAVEWWQKAASQGDAEALYQLGNCYQNGYGVEQDIEKAIEWWQEAAENGHEKAAELMQKLGLILKLI